MTLLYAADINDHLLLQYNTIIFHEDVKGRPITAKQIEVINVSWI